ncbi:DUF3014 domain-containing protein [Alteromonadaceae bacterium BrNp21-10]|nr:DUF3014 domain-containing protein [Alteromonadaceae bacterium BrNp21-10]
MSDNTESPSPRSFLPSIIIAAVLIIAVVVLYFWQPEPEEPKMQKVPAPQQKVDDVAPPIQPMVENTPVAEEELPQYNEPTPQPAPVEKPLDTSDNTIKSLIEATSSYEALAHVLVDDDLLNRFVVFTDNMASEQIANSHRLLKSPKQKFKVYQQADKFWIDASSFKRYSLYTDIFVSMETAEMVNLYKKYLPAISEKYLEIGASSDEFNQVLDNAIEHILDTPEVPTPIEVTTDSVMYKFVDERLESLSPVQKQLLRTGPENMRQIKAKLREFRNTLNAQ